ncbi:MAG: hydroxymethylbilane synthase [Pseudomonadota bacterium]
MNITIGTRGSKLALRQSEIVKDLILKVYPQARISLKIIKTKGDKILDVSLAKVGGKGLFVKEIEDCLLNGEIDLAVHSMKDVPSELPEGLEIASILKREDTRDALVFSTAYNVQRTACCHPELDSGSTKNGSLEVLPKNAKVGTSSLRRKAQLLSYRPDLEISDLRGNVNTRLRKLKEDGLDAIVLAQAGLNRLGLKDLNLSTVPIEILLPASAQGAVGIEIRCDNNEIRQAVDNLNDEKTYNEVLIERAFMKEIGGSCQVPVACLAIIEDSNISARARVLSIDGKKMIEDSIAVNWKTDVKKMNYYQSLGVELAKKLFDKGAKEILNFEF